LSEPEHAISRHLDAARPEATMAGPLSLRHIQALELDEVGWETLLACEAVGGRLYTRPEDVGPHRRGCG
jgi:hypothetical protein